MSNSKNCTYSPSKRIEKKEIMKRVSELIDRGNIDDYFEIRIRGSLGRHRKQVIDVQYAPNERFMIHPDEFEKGRNSCD